MYAAIVYAQPMFIPRIYDICPRTPNVYPRAPTVGADLSCPHITEYTLRIVHVHQRLPTYTHCRGRFIVPAYYGIYGVDNRVQSMFILVHPLGYGVAFIQFGTDGSDKSAPTPTECMLRLFMYNQCLFHVYTIFVPTSRCGLSSYTNVYPRTPTVMHDCIYTIRCERAR